MKLKNLTLVILLLLVSNYSKAQFGIRLEYGFNTLLNVNPNEITPYGHSGHQSNEQSSNSFTPSLSYRLNIYKDLLNFDLGVGYTRNKYSWDFKYQHRYVGMVDASLYVDLKYLQFPFLVNYKKKLNSNKYLSISGGLSLDVLISARDNYFDIVLEEIYIIYKHPQVRQHLLGRISLSQLLKKNAIGSIDIGAFAKYDLKNPMGIGWGFFRNLSEARNLQIGFGVMYFIN